MVLTCSLNRIFQFSYESSKTLAAATSLSLCYMPQRWSTQAFSPAVVACGSNSVLVGRCWINICVCIIPMSQHNIVRQYLEFNMSSSLRTSHYFCRSNTRQLYLLRNTWTQANSKVKPPHHNRFTALFPGSPGWAGARRELLNFIVQRKINRGRHTDHPTGRHSIQTNQCPPPLSPIYYTDRMPFLLPNQHCQSTEGN